MTTITCSCIVLHMQVVHITIIYRVSAIDQKRLEFGFFFFFGFVFVFFNFVCFVGFFLSLRDQKSRGGGGIVFVLSVILSLSLPSPNYIYIAIEKARSIPISELRNSRKSGTRDEISKQIPLVVTHNPRNINMYNSVKQCFPILQQSENLRSIIEMKNIIYSRRQPPNLKKLLTRAKFSTNKEKTTVSKCMDPRCGTFPYLKTGDTFTFKCGKTFTIRTNMSCKSRNLIYCMICTTCGENYIGQTGTKLADRVRVHKQQIRDPYNFSVLQSFRKQ